MEEMEEKVDRLEWELGIAKAQKERAEAQVAVLELQVQSGKKEEGSKEIRCLMVIEAEKTRAISQEAQRGREREEKLKKLQEEMIAGVTRSMEAGTKQAEEQKKVLRELEEARGLIGVLQKETHSQEDWIGELQEELKSWQQRSMRAEDLAQELQDQLSKSHTQARGIDKVLMQQVEQMKNFRANYEMLGKQMQSLEEELKTKERENEQLQTQLRSMEGENEKLGQQVWSLKTLIEDSLTKEEGVREENEQLQRGSAKDKAKIQSLETEGKRLQEASDQMAIKIQDLGEIGRSDKRQVTNVLGAGQEPQVGEIKDTVRERLEALGSRLTVYVRTAKLENQEQYQEVEVVKKALKEVEAQLETTRYRNPKHMELGKFPRDLGPEEPREEAEPGQPGGSTREEGAVEKELVTLQKEALPVLTECWNRRWEQWQSDHAKEMSQLKHQLKELFRLRDKRNSIDPSLSLSYHRMPPRYPAYGFPAIPNG
ncbi:golgin subfamily A member 6-like protein 22 [Alligator mississippiensis]|uniref:Golgin subfamily A member 6-like protein 22 n=1 Tax=Alligator mississippiensis TaxID=8496 RepID=A0A151P6N3_ALLMI|nr:golgin subfamily A member 6-like protein 22 [Alligator mississippiensis]